MEFRITVSKGEERLGQNPKFYYLYNYDGHEIARVESEHLAHSMATAPQLLREVITAANNLLCNLSDAEQDRDDNGVLYPDVATLTEAIETAEKVWHGEV